MCPVQLTDTVLVSYTASLANGEVIERVAENDPITVQIGSGKILKAVEASMLNMEVDEMKTVEILPEDAFGIHQKELVHSVPRDRLPKTINPKQGMVLAQTINRDGVDQQVPATITAVSDSDITIDYNHPLAGKKVTYTVKLHAIGN